MTISSNSRKAGPFIGNGTAATFPYTFKVFQASDLEVVKLTVATNVETVLALGTDYTAVVNEDQNSNPGGTITLTAGALAAGYNLVITSDIENLQPTDLTNQGGFYPEVITDALDRATIQIQQLQSAVDRAALLPITSSADAASLVADIVRLADSADNIDTVATNIANVNDVGDDIANVNIVAGNISNVNTVAGVSANVTTVATDIAAVNTVAADLNEPVSEIETVATNITNVNTVGTDIASVNTVAGISGNVTTVAGISANVTTVATNSASVATVATDIAAVTTVANDLNEPVSEIDVVANNIANVNTVGTNIASVNTAAGNNANITTVATNIANVNTTATNIANVNSVAGNSTNINAVAGNSTNINAVATNSTNINTAATNIAAITTVANDLNEPTSEIDVVANNIANVNTVGNNIADVSTVAGVAGNVNTVAGIAANVTTVAGISADVTAVASDATDIGTVSTNIANVNTVATNIAAVNTAASDIADIIVVANDLNEAVSEIAVVADNIASVQTVGDDITNVNTVATNIADVNTVAGDIADVTAVAGNATNINAVAGNSTNINAVATNSTNINTAATNIAAITTVANDLNEPTSEIDVVANNIANVNTVGTNIADVSTVAGVAGNVNTVAGIAPNVTTVAGISANVTTVAGISTAVTDVAAIDTDVSTVAAIDSDVTAVAAVASDIPTVAANVADISNFADVYQGAKSTPPTLRNDGGALQVGDLYFNTTSNAMFVRASTGWVPAGSSVNGTSQRYKYVATSGQTSFSGVDANGNTLTYDAGFIDVYLNGVHLDPTDYTATTGTSIVLGSGAALNDELYIVAFGTFNVASFNGSGLDDNTVNISKLDATGTRNGGTFLAGDNTFKTVAVTPTKNLIINGDMQIDQRNNGASVTPTLDPTYTLDRWVAFLSVSSKYAVQQNAGGVTPPAGFSNYLGVTSLSAYTASAAEYFGMGQYIEGFNTSYLAWGTASAASVTVSFWARSSLTGTFNVAFRNSTGSRGYLATYTINAANTWEQKTVTIPGDTTGTWLTNNGIGIRVWFDLGTGSNYQGTAGTWGSAPVRTAGSVSVVGTSGATFYITGVQLEKGSTATSFDYRPYGTELALCQRYLYAVDSNGLCAGVASSSSRIWGNVVYPVRMRSAPTAAITGIIQISDNNVADHTATPSIITVQGTSVGSRINLDGFSGLTAGRFYAGWSNGTPSGQIFYNAEL